VVDIKRVATETRNERARQAQVAGQWPARPDEVLASWEVR
jgi:hypothetical protein